MQYSPPYRSNITKHPTNSLYVSWLSCCEKPRSLFHFKSRWRPYYLLVGLRRAGGYIRPSRMDWMSLVSKSLCIAPIHKCNHHVLFNQISSWLTSFAVVKRLRSELSAFTWTTSYWLVSWSSHMVLTFMWTTRPAIPIITQDATPNAPLLAAER